jgi:hypothetical protein
VVIIVIFAAMVAYIVKIYLDNAKYIDSITKIQAELQATQGNLTTATQNLTTKDAEISKIKQSTLENQNTLTAQMQELKKTMDQQSEILKDYDQYKALGTSAIGLYSTLGKVATSVSVKDLQKIPLADYNLNNGTDSDNDGFSSEVEAALGTSASNADTDGDKYNDKQETLTGYDPLIAGKKLAIDTKFAAANKGKILKDAEKGYLWYIGFDGKKYFLGKYSTTTSATPATPSISSSSTATSSSTK